MKSSRQPQIRTLVVLLMGEDLERFGEEPTLVFPEEPGTYDPQTMTCWGEVGQHGNCSVGWVQDRKISRVVSNPEEMNTYLPLLRKYEKLYNLPPNTLIPAYRMTYSDYRKRVKEIHHSNSPAPVIVGEGV